MTNWIHKLFNPHCPDCRDELIDLKECKSCEILQLTIADLRLERDRLLNELLNKDKPIINQISDEKPQVLRTSNFIPSRVRRQMLEAEDREKARLMNLSKIREVKPSITDLESELGVDKIINNLESNTEVKENAN